METQTMMHLDMRNRNQLPWTDETWKQIDMAVHDECKRTKVASKFLPICPAPGATTIPSDTVLLSNRRDGQRLTIDETAITPILELEVGFQLTYQQMMEPNSSSTITLATRSANLLSQGVDIAIFQGQSAISGPNAQPLFADGRVAIVSGNAGRGLINAPEVNQANPAIQIIEVPTTTSPDQVPPRWGENTFGVVSDAYSRLQSGEGLNQAHYGPYACILNFQPYADTYAPLPTTLIIPADRIKPLVTEMAHSQMMNEATMLKHTQDMNIYGRDMSYMHTPSYYPRYYGTGTLPRLKGMFLSPGSNTMDLVIGQDATTEYVRQEGNFYWFRVYERFALRLKDPSSVIRLEFQQPTSSTPPPS